MSILVPLYIYPAPGAWNPLYAAIQSYPSVQFNVVINPASGPGNGSLPDARYTQEIPNLRNYTNVRTLGYVATNYTNKPLDDVVTEVKRYVDWPTVSQNPNISVDGIFLDETPNIFTEERYAYLKNISETIHDPNMFPKSFLVHNPGNIPLSIINAPNGTTLTYMDLANLTVIFEQTFDAWLDRTPYMGLRSLTISKESIAVILHSVPWVAPSVMKWIVSQLGAVSGHLFLVGPQQDGHYDKFSPLFSDFVTAIGAPDQLH